MSWPEQPVGELCNLVTSGGTPSTKRDEFYGGDIPWLRTQEVTFEPIWDTEIKITEAGLEGSAAKWIPENSVIVAMYGASAGRVAINKIPLATNQACCNLIVDPKKSDYRYVFYALRSRFDCLESLAKGAAQRNLNAGQIKLFSIPSPTIETQRCIADVLAAYDDLIENNRRRIQLLEQAARLLYKEWFVHLRFPGYEHVKVIDGVPEGWEKGVVSDFYDTTSGGTPSRKNPEFYGGTIRWVKTQELQDGFLFDTEEHITEEAIKKSSAKLFRSNTVLIAMYGATIGQVGVSVEPSTCNQACCAIIPKIEGTSYEHAFLFFLNNKEGLCNLGQGAAQKNISQQVIRAYEMVLPDRVVLSMFRVYAKSFLGQIRTLQAMNQQLAHARDLLLPKLMNGEISV